MRRPRLFLAAAGGAIALLMLFIGASPAAVHGTKSANPKAKVARQLEGSWQLVSFVLRSTDGALSYPYGRDAVGKLTYTRDGSIGLRTRVPEARPYRLDRTSRGLWSPSAARAACGGPRCWSGRDGPPVW